MKLHVIGVSRMTGTAKASGKPYDMAKLLCLQDVQIADKENYQRDGYGFEVCEVDMDPAVLTQFSQVKFPAMLECRTDNVMRFGKMQSLVVGLEKTATAAEYAKATQGA